MDTWLIYIVLQRR